MDLSGSSSRRTNSRRVAPTDAAMVTNRTQASFIGTTYKATWHPNQTRIRVGRDANNCLVPRLDETVKFLDPAGKVHNVAVTIHDGGQWFEHGLLQTMHFYNLHTEVEIQYTYRINNYFHLKIRRTNGLGEIQYTQHPEMDQHVKEEPQELIDIDDVDDYQVPGHGDRILWTAKITSAIEGGKQGLSDCQMEKFRHGRCSGIKKYQNIADLRKGGTNTAGRMDYNKGMSSLFGKLMGHNTLASRSNVDGSKFKLGEDP
ncbi:putative transcription factor [Sesbania bispinosa]|nr:putative transcription factor [Sesbania bispinosa]